TKRNTGASPDHLGKGQEIDHRADSEIARRVVEDDKTVRVHDRGEDSGAIPGVFDGNDHVPVAFETGPDVLAPPRLFAVAEAGAHPEEGGRGDDRAGQLQYQGSCEDDEGHDHGTRVPRHPDQRYGADLTERDRTPGFDS